MGRMYAGYAELASMLGFSAIVMALATRDWMKLRSFENPRASHQLFGWMVRGWVTPVALWLGWNISVFAGWLNGVIPLLPGIPLGPVPRAELGGMVAHSGALVVFTVTTYWMAFTELDLLSAYSHAEYKEDPRFWKGLFGLLIFPIAALTAWWLGPAGWGLAAALVLWPSVQCFTVEPRRHVPAYGRAVARMKFGDYRQAEQEIIRQLELCEDDYEGWMLLAQLYAEQFGEIANAAATVYELCDQPGVTPFHVSRAFQRLADWQLAGASDPKAARAALEEIVRRIPDTPFARTAAQRIAQLPMDREELQESRQVKRLRLPSLSDSPSPTTAPGPGSGAREAARRRLARLATRIAAAPEDFALREQRAVLLAEELGEARTAVRELEELLSRHCVPADRIPAWLAHVAGWRLRHLGDRAGAKTILERLIREYPGTPQGFGASGQLWSMEQETLAAEQVVRHATTPRIVVTMPPASEAR